MISTSFVWGRNLASQVALRNGALNLATGLIAGCVLVLEFERERCGLPVFFELELFYRRCF